MLVAEKFFAVVAEIEHFAEGNGVAREPQTAYELEVEVIDFSLLANGIYF